MSFLVDVQDKMYVLNNEQLEKLGKVLDECEIYCRAYQPSEGNEPSYYTHHVYKADAEDAFRSVKLYSERALVTARLSGRPKD